MNEQNLLLLATKFKKLRDKVETLSVKQDEIQQGFDKNYLKEGLQGDQGPKGDQGDRGFDGAPGLDGRDGKDGADGADGKDGVSVINAEIAFDGSLVLYLSNGDQIDCGEVTPAKSKEVFQTIKNSGGSSPIDIFTSLLPGLVPASGGGTTNFLRADGTFAAPPGGAPASPTTSVQFNNAGVFGGSANFTYNTGTNTFTVGPAGATTTIETLAPTGATVAGTLQLRGKAASATNGAGGGITYIGGNALGTGTGGGHSFSCGTGQTGGAISFSSANGTFNGGGMAFNAGNGIAGGTGGTFRMIAGTGNTTANGGRFEMNAGNANSSGSGGSFFLSSGFSLGGVGGDFTFLVSDGATANGSMYFNTNYGTVIQLTSSLLGDQQLGFFNATPVAQPTSVPVTAAGIHAALVSLGLIT